MALFGKKKNTEVKAEVAPVQKPASAPVQPARPEKATQEGSPLRHDLAHVLKHARITEKATNLQGQNVYVFDVADRASKRDVMLAVKSLYNVNPRKVAVINVRSKNTRNMRTGRAGVKRGGKKAYVFLKSGETITIS